MQGISKVLIFLREDLNADFCARCCVQGACYHRLPFAERGMDEVSLAESTQIAEGCFAEGLLFCVAFGFGLRRIKRPGLRRKDVGNAEKNFHVKRVLFFAETE